MTHISQFTKHSSRVTHWELYAWVVGVVLSVGIVCGVWIQAPRTYLLNLEDTSILQGSYGPEQAGSWLRGDSVLVLPQTYFASQQILKMQLQRFSVADAFAVTLSQQSANQATTAVSQIMPTIELRTVQYLLNAPMTGGERVRLQSPVQQFAGDKRQIGALIRNVSVHVVSFNYVKFTMYVLSFWLVCMAFALWLWKGRWLGLLVWMHITVCYIVVLHQEIQSGFYDPYILFAPSQRVWLCLLLVGLVFYRKYNLVVAVDSVIETKRRFGLDMLRFWAVMLVVISHGAGLLPQEIMRSGNTTQGFIAMGRMGVDLFFALSGYLIGRIILRTLENITQYDVVKRFWARRWLRTLPAAYVSAIVVWLFAPPNSFFAYLQSILFLGAANPYNVVQEMGFWWSLGVEEVFYFLFPFVVYQLCKTFSMTPSKSFVVSVMLFLIVPMATRLGLQMLFTPKAAYYLNVTIYARLDSMVYGLGIAWIYVRRRGWFNMLATWGMAPGIGMIVLGYVLTADLSRWYMVGIFLGHTFIIIGAALVIPALERCSTVGFKYFDYFVSWVALISYSVYLYHFMIYEWIENELVGASFLGDVPWTWDFGIYLCMTLLISWLSYRYVEAPILRWRDRHYPEIGRQAQE